MLTLTLNQISNGFMLTIMLNPSIAVEAPDTFRWKFFSKDVYHEKETEALKALSTVAADLGKKDRVKALEELGFIEKVEKPKQ